MSQGTRLEWVVADASWRLTRDGHDDAPCGCAGCTDAIAAAVLAFIQSDQCSDAVEWRWTYRSSVLPALVAWLTEPVEW